MISQSKFDSDLKEVCIQSRRFFRDPWIIRKSEWPPNAIWAELSEFIVDSACQKTYRRVSSLCYNETYNVPVFCHQLSFPFFDGKLVGFDRFKDFAFHQNLQNELDLRQYISQGEHPFLGIAFYNVHPCKTSEFMEPLDTRNYVLSFLSTIASIFVSNWSLEFFAAGLVAQRDEEPL